MRRLSEDAKEHEHYLMQLLCEQHIYCPTFKERGKSVK